MKKQRHWYAGISSFDIYFSYDAPVWKAFAFTSKKERDKWVQDQNHQSYGRVVAESITQKDAYKIIGVSAHSEPKISDTGEMYTEYTSYNWRKL